MSILVTNNPLVKSEYSGAYQVEYIDTDIHGVLIAVRDFIHKGHYLLTHPLSGSVKPNETLYKSVLLSEKTDNTDFKSVGIIEGCIITAKKFPPKRIPRKYKKDMQLVDLSLIRSALENN